MGENFISSTDLAKNLSQVLNRVRYRHESFLVNRNNETVAALKPPPEETKSYSGQDFLRDFGHRKIPRGFADGIDKAYEIFYETPEPPMWD